MMGLPGEPGQPGRPAEGQHGGAGGEGGEGGQGDPRGAGGVGGAGGAGAAGNVSAAGQTKQEVDDAITARIDRRQWRIVVYIAISITINLIIYFLSTIGVLP